MPTEKAEKWLQLIGPQLIALIVGAFAAYMTANVTLARLDERTAELEAKVKILESRTRDDGERLVRVETKIDIILEKQSRVH